MEKIDHEFKMFLFFCHRRENLRPAVHILDARAERLRA